MNIRVVLDTNIFISGIFWEGNYCSQIINTWRAGKIELVSSFEIVKELIEVLKDFKIKMPEYLIDDWRKLVIENSVIVVPIEKVTE